MILSLREAGRRLGGLSPAEVCALIFDGEIRGCLVDGSLKVEASALCAFRARRPLRILRTPPTRPVAREGHSPRAEVTP